VDLAGVVGADLLAFFRVTFADDGRFMWIEPDPTLVGPAQPPPPEQGAPPPPAAAPPPAAGPPAPSPAAAAPRAPAGAAKATPRKP
jgi:hypothetical protein